MERRMAVVPPERCTNYVQGRRRLEAVRAFRWREAWQGTLSGEGTAGGGVDVVDVGRRCKGPSWYMYKRTVPSETAGGGVGMSIDEGVAEALPGNA